ncbi:HNH endonuclease signature motif containing protein [Pseudonocardia acidicola]|uniref:DUF222 domain-containing protein n=1 Tax=Pseudonocardia acidicola TaxID=2724939 RepID=A0ABX1SAL2_9PSEU|nr:HNH endonuclease signature motif containing protein [Pseudonocardia acidicola]NMH97949.1 DUF222 domain-containing protein [Pseudonocardia acidicola]
MFDDMMTAEVESELVGMAGHLAAGTCRLLQLMAEFDRRDGWAGHGVRSCAHWLNWRVGMSLRTARDHLRVAHALRDLPATTAAFAAGRVSYSKVRALTRVATADSEESLLAIALNGTTSQLETLVRAARAGADARPVAARRYLRWTWASDGSLVLRARIPPEQGAVVIAEIEAATAGGGGSAEPPDAPQPAPEPSAEHHHAWQEAQQEQAARGAEHAPGPALDPVSARRVDALLALVAGSATPKAERLVVHLRVDDDATSAAGRPLAEIDAGSIGGVPIPVSTAARITCTADVQALLVDRRGNPLYLGRSRRLVSRAQLRALRARDRYRCAFPGCTHRRHLEAHHVRPWLRGGPTDIDNLLLLCGFHHMLVHDHGYRITAAEGGFRFARPDGVPVPDAGAPPHGAVADLVARHARRGIDARTITPDWGGERLDPNPILAWLIPELRERAAAA